MNLKELKKQLWKDLSFTEKIKWVFWEIVFRTQDYYKDRFVYKIK